MIVRQRWHQHQPASAVQQEAAFVAFQEPLRQHALEYLPAEFLKDLRVVNTSA